MIFQFAIVLAVAWVTAANPLAVYSRQSTNVECADLPTRCSDALKNYTQISRPGPGGTPAHLELQIRHRLRLVSFAVASAWAHF